MCGRYTLHTERKRIREQFKIARAFAKLEKLFSRYNIAPTQQVAAVRVAGEDGARELVALRWGLIPPWAKEAKSEYSTINARAETVAQKPTFRGPFRRRRCLIPADGFYEWATLPGGKEKQPLYITLKDGGLFAFAGLWERWEPHEGQEGEPVESCTIVVTDANALLRRVHDRMPVILDPAGYDLWLDPASNDPARLTKLLKPFDAERMTMRPVSRRVNSPKNDDPACIEPAEADA